jgi:hypothetical protein
MFDSDDEGSVTPIQPNLDVDLEINMNNTFSDILDDDNSSTGLTCQTFPSPLITSFQQPQFRKRLLPEHGFTAENAPSPSKFLLVVTYPSPLITSFQQPQFRKRWQKEPVESKGIASIESYVKHGRGLLWQNRSSCKLHYQTTSQRQPSMKSHTVFLLEMKAPTFKRLCLVTISSLSNQAIPRTFMRKSASKI